MTPESQSKALLSMKLGYFPGLNWATPQIFSPYPAQRKVASTREEQVMTEGKPQDTEIKQLCDLHVFSKHQEQTLIQRSYNTMTLLRNSVMIKEKGHC